MSPKDQRLLMLASHGNGTYPGIQQDLVEGKRATKLQKLGLIESYIPHNPNHKERWTLTDAGRAALLEGR